MVLHLSDALVDVVVVLAYDLIKLQYLEGIACNKAHVFLERSEYLLILIPMGVARSARRALRYHRGAFLFDLSLGSLVFASEGGGLGALEGGAVADAGGVVVGVLAVGFALAAGVGAFSGDRGTLGVDVEGLGG